MRVTLRHIEGKGIGYTRGYTTLEGFLSPLNPLNGSWVPFLDVRGHLFNNGKTAANAGVGLRYLADSRVWGANSYYDYRKTSHQSYNQIAMGLESLGEIWDFRINGYLPVGGKKSSFYGPAKFAGFREHYAFQARKYEFALKGANGEVGAHVNAWENVPLYFAAGPYYLEGRGKATWGGQARAALDFFDYVRVEGNASYDQIFKWIGQGQLSINIPFGGRRQIPVRGCNSCSEEMALAARAVQRIDRIEIIPVDKKTKETVAIDPVTGQPYFFLFVDNTSHSNGTFESPFNTLLAAQDASSVRDVIYIFPGDGTYAGMAEGFILKDYQKLLGSGIAHNLSTSLGTMYIPALSSTLPFLTDGGKLGIICANYNEIAGIHFTANGNTTISCANINTISIHENVLDLVNQSVGIGVLNFTGQMDANKNIFNFDSSFSFGVQFYDPANIGNCVFINNQFLGPVNSQSIGFDFGGMGPSLGDLGTIAISTNLFLGLGVNSIGGLGFNGNGRIDIDRNTFSFTTTTSSGVVYVPVDSSGNITTSITNNVWKNSIDLTLQSVYVENINPTSRVCATLIGNVTDGTSNPYTLDNQQAATFTADSSSNIGTVEVLGGVILGECP